jgi:hypothetical protein
MLGGYNLCAKRELYMLPCTPNWASTPLYCLFLKTEVVRKLIIITSKNCKKQKIVFLYPIHLV